MHVWDQLKECAKYAAANASIGSSSDHTPTLPSDEVNTPDSDTVEPSIALGDDRSPPPWQPVGHGRPRPPGRNESKRAKNVQLV